MLLNSIRRVFHQLRSWLAFYRLQRQVQDSEWQRLLVGTNLPVDRFNVTSDGSLSVAMRSCTLTLPKTSGGFALLQAIGLLEDLLDQPGWSIGWRESFDALSLQLGKTTYFVDCFEEVHTLHELFVAGDYDFYTTGAGLIVDVGANVGFTAMFLADNNPDAIVVACEPIAETYDRAVRNIGQNLHLSSRIELRQVALFDCDGSQTIATVPGNRVRSSFILAPSIANEFATEFRAIPTLDAGRFLQKLVKSHAARRVFLKMDCEGSEYAILRSIRAAGALSDISGIVMEWHKTHSPSHQSADSIREILLPAGFDVCALGARAYGRDFGMLYAFRSHASVGGRD